MEIKWLLHPCRQSKLKQLERLRSEDIPHRLMITHNIESYWIPSQKKTKRQSQSYKFKEFVKISNFWILKQMLHSTHLLKLLDIYANMKWIRQVLLKIQSATRFCPQTDRRTNGRTDGETDKVKPVPPPPPPPPPHFNCVEARDIVMKSATKCRNSFNMHNFGIVWVRKFFETTWDWHNICESIFKFQQFCSRASNYQCVDISLRNGLVPKKWHSSTLHRRDRVTYTCVRNQIMACHLSYAKLLS